MNSNCDCSHTILKIALQICHCFYWGHNFDLYNVQKAHKEETKQHLVLTITITWRMVARLKSNTAEDDVVRKTILLFLVNDLFLNNNGRFVMGMHKFFTPCNRQQRISTCYWYKYIKSVFEHHKEFKIFRKPPSKIFRQIQPTVSRLLISMQ
jgi:hypothetical protein